MYDNSKNLELERGYSRLLEKFAHTRIDDYTLIKSETAENAVPHTYLSYEEVLALLSDFEIIKIQQIFDYWEQTKHAHFFITCRIL